MKRKIIHYSALCCLLVLTGCTFFGKHAVNKSIQPQEASAAAQRDSSPSSVGFTLFLDNRPEQDVTYMESVREKVSAKILTALKKTDIFSAIHFPSREDDVVIIRGEIRKFSVQSFDTMISYIPVLNALNLLGVPATRTEAAVELYLEIMNHRTGEVILSLHEQQAKKSRYSLYSYTPEKAGKELAYCFATVLNKMQAELLVNQIDILEHIARMKKVAQESAASRAETPKIEKAAEEAAAAQQRVQAVETKVKKMEEKLQEVQKKIQATEQQTQKVQKKEMQEKPVEGDSE